MLGAGAAMIGAAGANLIVRTIANKISDRFYNILSKDLYDENLLGVGFIHYANDSPSSRGNQPTSK